MVLILLNLAHLSLFPSSLTLTLIFFFNFSSFQGSRHVELVMSQLSSCFLLCMKNYSIEGIYDTLNECVVSSKLDGGIRVFIHNIYGISSYIHGTNGTFNGIVLMIWMFKNTTHYIDLGGGKRKGIIMILILAFFLMPMFVCIENLYWYVGMLLIYKGCKVIALFYISMVIFF